MGISGTTKEMGLGESQNGYLVVLDNNKKSGLEVHSPWPSSFGSLLINQHGLIAILPQPIYYYYYSSCCSQCFILMKIWATTRLPKVKPKKNLRSKLSSSAYKVQPCHLSTYIYIERERERDSSTSLHS
jgi:hypothetical protein